MSCLSVPSHLPPPFLTAFWDAADDLPLAPLPLPTSLLWGMSEAELLVPVGLSPRRIPSYRHGRCPVQLGVVKGIPAELCSSIPTTGMNMCPPSAALRCFLVASLAEDRAAGLLCLSLQSLQSLGTFPSLTDRVYWNCRRMFIAVRLQLQCPGCVHSQAGL